MGIVLLTSHTSRGRWELIGLDVCTWSSEILLVSRSDWWSRTAIIDIRHILLLDRGYRFTREVLPEAVIVNFRWGSWRGAIAFVDGSLSRQEVFQDESDP